MAEMDGVDVDVRGRDLRLAPFGAGRRVYPRKNLGLAMVALWVAKLVDHFDWAEDKAKLVDLSELRKIQAGGFSLSQLFLAPKPLCDEYVVLTVLIALISIALLKWAFSPGGVAWKNGRNSIGAVAIPGPRGLPIFGSLFTLSRGLAHRSLASMALHYNSKQLMAFSLGSTPVVVTSDPQVAKEILTSPHFADRPIKQSTRSLMFSRAIGFAPNGTYWRLLRRIAASHLFAPRRIAAHE
ncbi:cytochrome [Sesamum angolense]|uniref:Cytochrome n=1 Tax=Sesamum angolense TaxID=2727404 RepID=A0AAE1T8P4_9LAMI|nr:cytochrome [Sesamum angolense]